MTNEERKDSAQVDHLELRRRLRKESTDAERRLWRLLRSRQLGGFKFRRQHQFGPYILDFFCPERQLAVEADGGQHLIQEGLARDEERTLYLQSGGIRVLRFTNLEVLLAIGSVKESIWLALTGEPSP